MHSLIYFYTDNNFCFCGYAERRAKQKCRLLNYLLSLSIEKQFVDTKGLSFIVQRLRLIRDNWNHASEVHGAKFRDSNNLEEAGHSQD